MKDFCSDSIVFEQQKELFLKNGNAPQWFLEQIWIEQKIERSFISYLIEFLVKFEILIRTVDKDGKKIFLIPSLMEKKLLNDLDIWKSTVAFKQVGRKFVFPFYSPPGLFQRFIAKTYSLSQQNWPYNNIMISLFRSSIKLLSHCYKDENGNEMIDLIIRSESERNSYEHLLEKLDQYVDLLEKLLDEWPGLYCSHYCICFCKGEADLHLIDVKDVVKEQVEGNLTLFCIQTNEVQISTLLKENTHHKRKAHQIDVENDFHRNDSKQEVQTQTIDPQKRYLKQKKIIIEKESFFCCIFFSMDPLEVAGFLTIPIRQMLALKLFTSDVDRDDFEEVSAAKAYRILESGLWLKNPKIKQLIQTLKNIPQSDRFVEYLEKV
jgi:hypothetical protein